MRGKTFDILFLFVVICLFLFLNVLIGSWIEKEGKTCIVFEKGLCEL